MAMQIGDVTATGGMAQAIYDQIRANLEPELEPLEEAARVPIREGWQKLAHAIATGVVTHVREHLQARDPESPTDAAPVLDVAGATASAEGGAAHSHAAGSLTVALETIAFH